MSIGCRNSVAAKGATGKSRKDAVKKPRRKPSSRRLSMWIAAGRRSLCLPRIACIPQPGGLCRNEPSQVVEQCSQGLTCKIKEHNEFVSWLKKRGEGEGCSAITVGMSTHGRALFAARPIHTGECVLQVSRDLMVTPEKLPDEVKKFLPGDVTEWARLALFLLAEKHAGQTSAWAPYVECLPPLGAIQSTIFWKKEELSYLKQSPVHRETIQRRAIIRMEYSAVENALKLCPHVFGDRVTLRDFKHAYATVCSRAWGIEALKTLALVPFVDFINHSSNCRTLLSYDEDKECAEVIADRDYATGEQVVISYGQLPNATLALDFGFALPYNPCDQCELWMAIPKRDGLFDSKLQLLHSHKMETLPSADGSDSGGNAFILQEVKSAASKGKGIPQSLRAFARVAASSSSQELSDLAAEAAASDGRLARHPMKDRSREAQAMNSILACVESCIQEHTAALVALQTASQLTPPKREIAEAVLGGELRVLRSASQWLRQQLTQPSID